MIKDYFFNFTKLDYVKGKKPQGCILCRIVQKDKMITDLSIFENEQFIASVNLYPYNPGHIMIFPKRHIEDVRELSLIENEVLFKLQGHFLSILDQTHTPSGFNIGYNMGIVAGGSIRHLHLHIIPRYPNEIGIAELIGGKKMLVEDPRETMKRLKDAALKYFASHPF